MEIIQTQKEQFKKSMYDMDRKRIVEWLKLGVSIIRHISLHHLDYGPTSSLHYYVSTRRLQPDSLQLIYH